MWVVPPQGLWAGALNHNKGKKTSESLHSPLSLLIYADVNKFLPYLKAGPVTMVSPES